VATSTILEDERLGYELNDIFEVNGSVGKRWNRLMGLAQ
jgi:hypothetical protein